jgi:hypothetical protein
MASFKHETSGWGWLANNNIFSLLSRISIKKDCILLNLFFSSFITVTFASYFTMPFTSEFNVKLHVPIKLEAFTFIVFLA